MILPDYPIKNNDDDKLGRAPLAKKVSELVATYQGNESFVVGIEGQWGSGKTSFINLVVNHISDKENLIFIHFNPWNFSGQNELISDFFSALLEALEGKVNKGTIQSLKTYATKLQVSFSPSIPTGFGTINLPTIGRPAKSLGQQRKEIDSALRNLDKKIVVIIDDTDRLDEDETKLIMKLVKMTANFPNTVFLLAYDREQVARKLGEEKVGNEYLKKIIQVSFTLPKPDEEGLKRIIFSDLDSTIKDVYGEVKIEGEDERRWGMFLYKGFLTHFKTVRDIKGYISSLRLNWSLVHPSDVNQIDFLIIEMVRVFYPEVYSFIAGNRRQFVNAKGYIQADKEKITKSMFDEVVSKLDKAKHESLIQILSDLFPKLENNNHSGETEMKWRQEKRICAGEQFGFYFQLGVPDGSISDVEIQEIIVSLEKEERFIDALKSLKEDNKLRVILSRILDKLDKLTEEQISKIISGLWKIDAEVFEERKEMFDYDDVPTQIYRISFYGLKALPETSRYEVMKQTLDGSPTLRIPLRIIEKQISEKQKDSSQFRIFTDEEIEKLKVQALTKLQLFADNNTLDKEGEYIRILYEWKKLASPEKVKKYIEKLVNSNEGLITFLNGCITTVLSTAGDYKKISPKTIEGLYSLDDIKLKVKSLPQDFLKNLSPEEKEVIRLFNNPDEDDLIEEK